MASLYEQAFAGDCRCISVKMAAESGAPESEPVLSATPIWNSRRRYLLDT